MSTVDGWGASIGSECGSSLRVCYLQCVLCMMDMCFKSPSQDRLWEAACSPSVCSRQQSLSWQKRTSPSGLDTPSSVLSVNLVSLRYAAVYYMMYVSAQYWVSAASAALKQGNSRRSREVCLHGTFPCWHMLLLTHSCLLHTLYAICPSYNCMQNDCSTNTQLCTSVVLNASAAS